MNNHSSAGFSSLRVLSLESRRAPEMARLITNQGGEPMVVQSMREVPLEDNHEARDFVAQLVAGKIDLVIFLSGGGTRVLLRTVAGSSDSGAFLEALKRVPTLARGPKPVTALAEVGIRPTITVPEPNTWREVLGALDVNRASVPLAGRTVAVQEYGSANQELLSGLAERGASTLQVPVYDWRLPEDVEPLRAAAKKLAAGEIDVVLFTTSVQVRHLIQIAREMSLEESIRSASERMFMASIGPVTSGELRRHRLPVDLEPSHPKMGFLVREAAEQSAAILNRKRNH